MSGTSDGGAPGRLLLVTGGASLDPHPVARAVAARLDRAVHVDLEALQDVVVSGAPASTLPSSSGPPDPEVVEQLFLRWIAGIAVAETYQRAGYDAVLSERVGGQLLDDLLDFVDPTPVHLVSLGREAPQTPDLRDGTPRGLSLDVEAGSSAQLAEAVLHRLDEALVR